MEISTQQIEDYRKSLQGKYFDDQIGMMCIGYFDGLKSGEVKYDELSEKYNQLQERFVQEMSLKNN